MKEATKAIIELTINNDDEIDSQIAELILNALQGHLPTSRSSNPADPLLLKMNDAAKRLGVSRVTFWRLVNSGAIKPVEIFENVFRYNYGDLVALSEKRSHYSPKARGKKSAT